jgi:hypothetical protein
MIRRFRSELGISADLLIESDPSKPRRRYAKSLPHGGQVARRKSLKQARGVGRAKRRTAGLSISENIGDWIEEAIEMRDNYTA